MLKSYDCLQSTFLVQKTPLFTHQRMFKQHENLIIKFSWYPKIFIRVMQFRREEMCETKKMFGVFKEYEEASLAIFWLYNENRL